MFTVVPRRYGQDPPLSSLILNMATYSCGMVARQTNIIERAQKKLLALSKKSNGQCFSMIS